MTTRAAHLLADDTGSMTIEYALTTVVAATLAALLYQVISGETVFAALERLVRQALETPA
jgi:Flp pilus assembly pilin Flp